MHISLAEQGTRGNDSAGKSGEELAGIVSAVWAETEFVEVGLEFGAAAMVGTQRKGFELEDFHFEAFRIGIELIQKILTYNVRLI